MKILLPYRTQAERFAGRTAILAGQNEVLSEMSAIYGKRSGIYRMYNKMVKQYRKGLDLTTMKRATDYPLK
jgi:hypothetical protein